MIANFINLVARIAIPSSETFLEKETSSLVRFSQFLLKIKSSKVLY